MHDFQSAQRIDRTHFPEFWLFSGLWAVFYFVFSRSYSDLLEEGRVVGGVPSVFLQPRFLNFVRGVENIQSVFLKSSTWVDDVTWCVNYVISSNWRPSWISWFFPKRPETNKIAQNVIKPDNTKMIKNWRSHHRSSKLLLQNRKI